MKKMNQEKILVTGCAGFIGMHLCKTLLDEGFSVLGIDNLNNYYDTNLKLKRLDHLINIKNFSFEKVDIIDLKNLKIAFDNFSPDKVINLAAQAGVRYSIVNPHAYIDTNISGFMNVLECCRIMNVKGLIYASSSSVYGNNCNVPFSEKDNVDNPVSIYAASKKANELMAKTYNELYNLHSTGLRFFTVYGPWGRPDMAYYLFTKKIINNETIRIFNFGAMERDYTYIDDIVKGIISAIKRNFFCEIINLGNNKSEKLLDMVNIIEDIIGKKAKIKLEPMQLGDVKKTYADIKKAKKLLLYNPKINLDKGLVNFCDWFLKSH